MRGCSWRSISGSEFAHLEGVSMLVVSDKDLFDVAVKLGLDVHYIDE